MKARLWCTTCDAPVVASHPADELAIIFPSDGTGWGVFEVECMEDAVCPAFPTVDTQASDAADEHVADGWVLRFTGDDRTNEWLMDVRLSSDAATFCVKP